MNKREREKKSLLISSLTNGTSVARSVWDVCVITYQTALTGPVKGLGLKAMNNLHARGEK